MKVNHVWIVEMLIGENWDPTTGVGLDKQQAREVLKEWQHRNPNDMFRLTKYIYAGK